MNSHRAIPFLWASLVLVLPLAAQPPQRPPRIVKSESRVIVRGDREILTFESEADFLRLEELYEAARQAPPAPGALTMRYFRSGMDGSVQPYAVWLPKDYDGARKYPLLVQLHGIAPKSLAGGRTRWKGMGVPEWIDPNAPVVVVHGYGRLNTFYRGMGEEDVLEAIADAYQHFSIDPEHIFLMGHSMGGAGSYTIGLHYPDRFGSILAVDPAMWKRDPQAELWMPDWMQPQLAMGDVEKLYPNARNINVFFKNAGAGIQGKSTTFADGIVAEGGFSTTESFPGMPHHFAPQLSYAMFTGEAASKPRQRSPKEVKFYTNTVRYNEAYWVTIDALTRAAEDARVTATYEDGQPRPAPPRRPGMPAPPEAPVPPPSVKVSTVNIDKLTLRLGDTSIPAGTRLPLTVDGQEVMNGELLRVVKLRKSTGTWRIEDAAANLKEKRHGLQGPIGDAFNSRFLAVYGEGDRALAIAELDALRNPPGEIINHGDFPMKPAAKVTGADIASSNLILFGTPASNPILRRIAPSLPQALIDGDAVFIYPNPESPEHYVVIWPIALLSLTDNWQNYPMHDEPESRVVSNRG